MNKIIIKFITNGYIPVYDPPPIIYDVNMKSIASYMFDTNINDVIESIDEATDENEHVIDRGDNTYILNYYINLGVNDVL